MTVAVTSLSATGERVRVFDELPELVQNVDNGDLPALKQITTKLLRIEPGIWQLEFGESDVRGHLGLLVLDGLLARQVTIGEATCAELLGGGDVLRPWTELERGIVSIPAESCWQVVLPTRMAVLGARFALQIARWPDVTAAIIDRVVQRARWLSFHLAVCHIVGVEVRLLIVLWHFADRWGRVTPNGLKLPLPLSHGLLAGIVGARRPTVSTALGVLREQGLVERTHDGWLLRGDPPSELQELRGRVTAREPTIAARGAEGTPAAGL
jgi:CRP/FNR family transcriptional regulator, cyclic AMP receptor protein